MKHPPAEARFKEGHALGKFGKFASVRHCGPRAAIIYTLVECAKRHGHNPEAYLTDVLVLLSGMKASDAASLTPPNWKKARATEAAAKVAWHHRTDRSEDDDCYASTRATTTPWHIGPCLCSIVSAVRGYRAFELAERPGCIYQASNSESAEIQMI